MNIFRYEFRHYLKSSAWYLLGMLAMALLYFSFYPGFSRDAGDFLKLLEAYPPQLQQALGLDFLNLLSLLGYYSFMLVFIALTGAVWAMDLGVSILSREEREKTADFLFTRPASRGRIVGAKIAAGLALIGGSTLVYIPVSWLILKGISGGETFDFGIFLQLNASLPFLELLFFSLGLFLGVFLRRIRSTISISLGVVFGFFAVGAFGVTQADDPLRWLAPFKYFETKAILAGSGPDGLFLAVGALLVLAFLALAGWLTRRKDLLGA